MKRLLLILILTFSFQTLTKADDIRDFEIEGMSIGDSLLDYFTNKQVKKFVNITYDNANDKKFHKLEITDDSLSSRFKEYDSVAFYIKKNDKKYIIQSIIGIIFFENKIKDCLKKKDLVVNELSTFFDKDNTRIDKGKHRADKSGKSTYENLIFELDGGHQVIVSCLDWSKAFEKKYFDHMKVWVNHTEFKEFIISNPF